MPNLRLFVVCEKIIFDRESNAPTLVTVIQGIKVVVSNKDIPASAMSFSHWAVFAWWYASPQEIGKKFTQYFELIAPDRTIALPKQTLEFTFDGSDHRTSAAVQGFPIGQQGEYVVRMWLESEFGISEDHLYSIKIEHVVPPPS